MAEDRSRVPAAFHHFAGYLRSKAPNDELTQLKGAQSCGGCLIPISVMPIVIGLASETRAIVLLGFFLASVGIVAVAVLANKINRFKDDQVGFESRHGAQVLAELMWMHAQKQLEPRCHPRLIPLLEACAVAWSRTMTSLDSEAWKARAKDPHWSDLRKAAMESAEGAMLDALWASRDLVRRKGWRRSTFEERCADPEYGRHAFARLALILSEMEDLANHVSDEVYTHPLEQSEIRRVLSELQLVREAEEELDRDAPRLGP